MVEYDNEQGIGSYESKFLGPLTFRQTVCLSIGVPICWSMYHHLAPILSKDLVGFLVAVPASLCAAIGWCKPYGMKTENYLKAVLFCRFLHPRKLLYKVVNQHEKAIKSIRTQESAHMKQEKKHKYKVSAEAIR